MGIGIGPGPGGGGGTQHDFKASCRLATAAAMAASTRVGNVRTANANGVMLDVDGITPAVGDSILDRSNATAADRGIWVVDSVGVADPGGSPWQMTRRFDASAQGEISAGMRVPVTEGTSYTGRLFKLDNPDPITVNATALAFSLDGVDGVPTRADKALSPLATVGNGAPTGLTIGATPAADGYVGVSVNGNAASVGDGVLTRDCYFSDPTGAPRPIASIVAGDALIWNGVIAGYNLAPADIIDLNYDI